MAHFYMFLCNGFLGSKEMFREKGKGGVRTGYIGKGSWKLPFPPVPLPRLAHVCLLASKVDFLREFFLKTWPARTERLWSVIPTFQ